MNDHHSLWTCLSGTDDEYGKNSWWKEIKEYIFTYSMSLIKYAQDILLSCSHKGWMLLREMLSLIEPYSQSLYCFDQKAEVSFGVL